LEKSGKYSMRIISGIGTIRKHTQSGRSRERAHTGDLPRIIRNKEKMMNDHKWIYQRNLRPMSDYSPNWKPFANANEATFDILKKEP
jgi:hypothetical protein